LLQFHYRKSHGLADEEMPKIEREIPYTLSAYSGGILDNSKIYDRKKAKEKLAARCQFDKFWKKYFRQSLDEI
jgi:hypothetical protein